MGQFIQATALLLVCSLLLPLGAKAAEKIFEPYRDFVAMPELFPDFIPIRAKQAALCLAWEQAFEYEKSLWEKHGFFPYTDLSAAQKNALAASPEFISVYYQDTWWGKPTLTTLPQDTGHANVLVRAFAHSPTAADKTLRAFLFGDWQEERRAALVEVIQEKTHFLKAITFFTPQGEKALENAQRLAEETFTLILYNELLALLDNRWEKPEEALAWLMPMREIAPENPFFALTHAELMVQQERPQAALESLAVFFGYLPSLMGAAPSDSMKALQRQGYEVRGLACFLSGKLSLAEEDFTRALAEKPSARLFLSRGIARQTRNDMPAACEDFYQACSLGACEGLATAREKGLCTGK